MCNRVSMITFAMLVMVLTAIATPSDEVTFKTATTAPTDFEMWTFFWEMPTIDSSATLESVVIQPDGKKYFRYVMPRETHARQGISGRISLKVLLVGIPVCSTIST